MTAAEIRRQLELEIDRLAREGTPRIVIAGDKLGIVWGPPIATLCWLLPGRILAELEAAVTEQVERHERVSAK